MHIPDGFLSAPVWAGLDLAAAPAVGYLARRAQREFEDARVPLLGVMGAFVFAAQMINFPVGVGTSGHLIGGALLTYTLGPAAAAVVMTAILALQALVFQDGGVLALGANVMNMAVAGVLAAYLPFRFWGAGRWRGAALFCGAVLSVLVSAALALSELLVSGVRMPSSVLGVSLGLFLVSGLLEGLITVAVMQALERMNPDFARRPAAAGSRVLGALGMAAVLLATGGMLLASTNPDGLESLAARVGLAGQARSLLPAPLPDYEITSLQSPWLRKALAGVMGLALIFGLCVLLGRWTVRRRSA